MTVNHKPGNPHLPCFLLFLVLDLCSCDVKCPVFLFLKIARPIPTETLHWQAC